VRQRALPVAASFRLPRTRLVLAFPRSGPRSRNRVGEHHPMRGLRTFS